DGRVEVEANLHQAGRHAAEEIEDQILDVPEGVLDVVAEDPEVEHVAAEVQPAGVQEHRGQQGDVDGQPDLRVGVDAAGDLARHRAPLHDEALELLFGQGHLVQESRHVDGDHRIVAVGKAPALSGVVTDGEHRASPGAKV